jgi:hypothetical protein
MGDLFVSEELNSSVGSYSLEVPDISHSSCTQISKSSEVSNASILEDSHRISNLSKSTQVSDSLDSSDSDLP